MPLPSQKSTQVLKFFRKIAPKHAGTVPGVLM